MAASARHPDTAARSAAHDALAGLTLSGTQLAPLLAPLADDGSAAAVKRRRAAPVKGAAVPEGSRSVAVDTLEMLQWRGGLEEPAALIAPLQGVVRAHVATLQKQAAMHTYGGGHLIVKGLLAMSC